MDAANGGVARASASPRTGPTPLTFPAWYKQFITLLIAATLVWPLFVGVTGAQGNATCHQSVAKPTFVTSVHVQPGAGYEPILDEIDAARCSIDISMYILTSEEVVQALDYAERRGVRVRVILDEVPFGYYGTQQEMFDQLIGIGVEVKWSPPSFQFSHAKYMIIDNSVLLVTNQNFTGAGFNSNREFGVVTTEPGRVGEAMQVFESDWNNVQSPTTFQHLVVSPVNSRSTIVGLINASQESVWLYAEVLRDEEVTRALDSAVARGVDVRLLVNPSASDEDAPYFLDVLSHGVQVRVLNTPYVHSKALIIDGNQVLIGSQNYSLTSLDRNRELGIVLDDPEIVQVVSSTFIVDWQRGEPVDTITIGGNRLSGALTLPGRVGTLTSGRWGVV